MPIAQGYIGRSPGDSSVVIARQTFSPTGIQTDFTFASGYVVGYLDLYLNGARLIEGQDFTATDGSVVGLTTYAQSGDVLELVAYKAFNLSNVTGSTGDFSIPDKIVHTDDLDTAIRFPQNDTFTVETAGTERLRIDSSGNIGIGTNSPSSIAHIRQKLTGAQLTLDSASGFGFNIRATNNTSNNTLGLYGTRSSGTGSSGTDVIIGSTNTRSSGRAIMQVQNNGTSLLHVDAGGSIGIGTDNPASILHLLGTAPRITLTDTAGTDDVGKIFSTGGALFLQHRDGAGHGEIIFRTENSSTAVERLRITADGKVRVPDTGRFTCGTDDDLALRHSGTTGVLENNTGHFYIDQNTDDSDIYLRSDNGSGGVTNYVQCDGSSGAVILNHYGTEKFTTTSSGVEVTGNIYAPTGIGTAIQWDATSDITLKENIEIINEPIVKLSQLKGVTFDWKFGGHSVGVIAQDVEKVLPTAVGGSKDQKTVNYNAIIGLLVESVKDQQKQIEELKSLLDK